jgi:hypothetical protein
VVFYEVLPKRLYGGTEESLAITQLRVGRIVGLLREHRTGHVTMTSGACRPGHFYSCENLKSHIRFSFMFTNSNVLYCAFLPIPMYGHDSYVSAPVPIMAVIGGPLTLMTANGIAGVFACHHVSISSKTKHGTDPL